MSNLSIIKHAKELEKLISLLNFLVIIGHLTEQESYYFSSFFLVQVIGKTFFTRGQSVSYEADADVDVTKGGTSSGGNGNVEDTNIEEHDELNDGE